MPSNLSKKQIEALIQSLAIVLVDDNAFMRRTTRNILINCGVKEIYEAADGIAGLDAIRNLSPDIVILDWVLPLLSGSELVRIVRSPGAFPKPDVPIIVLSGHGEHWRVVEAVRLGVNEYLVKPVSAKTLYNRLLAILTQPRPAVRRGEYYGPAPRKLLAEPTDQMLPTAPATATTLN